MVSIMDRVKKIIVTSLKSASPLLLEEDFLWIQSGPNDDVTMVDVLVLKSLLLCVGTLLLFNPIGDTKVCVVVDPIAQPVFDVFPQNGVKHLTQVFGFSSCSQLSMGSLNDWPFTMECFRPSEQNRHEEDHEKSKHLSWLHNKFKLTFQSLTLDGWWCDLEIDICY